MTRDVIFCGPGKDFKAQCECLASEFGLRKIVLQKKKSLKLKLRENSNYRRDEIYLQKSSSSSREKNARKSLLKAFVSQKEIYTAMFLKLCAVEIYTHTNLLLKLRKCCHEEMVDNCHKSRMVLHLQVTAKEVMTRFFFFQNFY